MKTRSRLGAAILAVMLCLTAVLAGCSNGTKAPGAEAPKVEEADVVIIGAGGAGLSAAVTAAENGAQVIVVEKMPAIGGNTIRAAGAFNCADPERQSKQGIEDSPEKHMQQTLEGGDNVADPELVRTLTFNALDSLHWLESHGMKFQDKISQTAGSLWPRSHAPVEAGGYIKTLKAACEKLGIKILVDTKATELVTNDEGRVVGVKCEDKDKKAVEFKAKKAVIMATGGFGANIEMCMKYDSKLSKDVKTTNHPGATGDGIIMAEKIGADTTGMEYIQMHPLADSETGALRGRARETGSINSVIDVNKEGQRFVNEGERRDVLTAAVLAQTDGMCFEVNDSQIVGETNEWGENMEEMVKEGRVFKADTIADLEKQLGMPEGNLEKTIADFNKAVEQKKDSEFGRTIFETKIEKGPFYAVPRAPSVHHTMGGLKINTQAQVITTEGKVIPGFYAAGEVTGGIHGSNRLGGNAIADVITFGRIAGKNASQE